MNKEFWSEKVGEAWAEMLKPLLTSARMYSLMSILDKEYRTQIVFPKYEEVFRAFKVVHPTEVKHVVIGGCPYYDCLAESSEISRATGLAFANHSSVSSISPSLKGIRDLLEYHHNLLLLEFDTTLEEYAKANGILFLNRSLSVRKGQSNSHRELWNGFMNKVLSLLDDYGGDFSVHQWGKEAEGVVVPGGINIYPAEHPACAVKQNRLWKNPHVGKLFPKEILLVNKLT